jgi:hypothetical protein
MPSGIPGPETRQPKIDLQIGSRVFEPQVHSSSGLIGRSRLSLFRRPLESGNFVMSFLIASMDKESRLSGDNFRQIQTPNPVVVVIFIVEGAREQQKV